jgi:hypothetical protein
MGRASQSSPEGVRYQPSRVSHAEFVHQVRSVRLNRCNTDVELRTDLLTCASLCDHSQDFLLAGSERTARRSVRFHGSGGLRYGTQGAGAKIVVAAANLFDCLQKLIPAIRLLDESVGAGTGEVRDSIVSGKAGAKEDTGGRRYALDVRYGVDPVSIRKINVQDEKVRLELVTRSNRLVSRSDRGDNLVAFSLSLQHANHEIPHEHVIIDNDQANCLSSTASKRCRRKRHCGHVTSYGRVRQAGKDGYQ